MERMENNSTGSTLIILLLTIAIVVMIGTMALSLAVKNHKMKNLDSELKQTFYLAEAGIDEAYILTLYFINEAIDYAISKVEEFEETEMNSNLNLGNIHYLYNNAINDDKLNIVFTGAFKNFVKGNCIDINPNDSLIELLKKNSTYVTYEDGYPKIESEIIETNGCFLVEIKSTYVKGTIMKVIIVKFSIYIPNYYECISNVEFNSKDIIKDIEWRIER